MGLIGIKILNFETLVAVIVLGVMVLLAGAMNGGVALTATDFDVAVTYLKNNWLLSTFIIFLSMVALIATLWQLVNGQGFGNASIILLVIVVGVLGYSLITTGATATQSIVQAANKS